MVVQIEHQVVGLLVDAVSDILTVDRSGIQPTPDVASDDGQAVRPRGAGHRRPDDQPDRARPRSAAARKARRHDAGATSRDREATGSRAPRAGEFVMTGSDFRQIAAMLHADAGIYLPKSKATLVYSRLAKRLRALGLKVFATIARSSPSADGADERQADARGADDQRHRASSASRTISNICATQVLPPLVERRARGGASASGRRPVRTAPNPIRSALTLLSLMPDAAVLRHQGSRHRHRSQHGRRGRARRLSATAPLQPVPADLRQRWFAPARDDDGKAWSVADEALRSIVAFRELNLIGDWPMRGKFDAIFCRNVVIYFEETTQARVWSRFAPLLAPRRPALHRPFGTADGGRRGPVRRRRHHDLSPERRERAPK